MVAACILKGFGVYLVACFLAVKACLNAVFWGLRGHGKSPCFLGCGFLWAVGVDG